VGLEQQDVGHVNERRDEVGEIAFGTSPAATRLDGSPAGTGITLYGAWWCGDTRRSVGLLDRLGLDYAQVDVDADPAANAWAAAQNGGQRRIPVVVLGAGGPTLIEPSDEALLTALGETGRLVGAAEAHPAVAERSTGRGTIAAR
jgi:mycoredoxin